MKRFCILCAALAAVSCGHRGKGDGGNGDKVAKTVRTDTVRIWGEGGGRELESSRFPGKVRASADIDLAFKVSGTIEHIDAEAGAFVRRGQVVVRMDERDYALQFSATEAEYTQIKGEAERVMALFEKGSVTQNDYEKAKYGLQQITAKYNAHRNALEDTRLKAPFDGYVQRVFFKRGETVGAGMPVVSFVGGEVPEVEINIPAADFVRRDRFGSFSATVDVYPGVVFPLALVGVNRKANLNQLHTVRLRFLSNSKTLPPPGMSAMVTINYKPNGAAEATVTIPASALFERDGGSTVWIFDPASGKVSARGVTLLRLEADGTAVISEGVAAGDIVVTAGVNSLSEGQAVRPLAPTSKTNAGGML